NPEATEVCNGKDDDCDEQIDECVCFTLSCTDSSIQCVKRIDSGDDGDNLVDGKPKVDAEYEFRVVVTGTGCTPQYVKLFVTQRSNPVPEDFYGYSMTCSGDFSSGATCTYKTKLGPAAVHKFYFEAKFSDGATIKKYPETGYITGPEVQLLTGYNLVGAPRDINTANLDGQNAFGSSITYRWDADLGYYTKVTTLNPVKVGEGYFTYKANDTLLELADYGDVLESEYTYQLKHGWNIISNPYAGNVKLPDIKVQKGSGTPVSWEDATDNGWIVNAIYYYNGRDWGKTYSFETADDGATLVPWMGYWVYLNKDDDTYSLVIPKP
ncbi:MAG: putative metal-binding motif-containing protein, partial [Nitrospirota bacterium]